LHQGGDHGLAGHQTEALGAGTGRRQAAEDGIDRYQEMRPAMPRSQDVPGSQDRWWDSAGSDKGLALLPYGVNARMIGTRRATLM